MNPGCVDLATSSSGAGFHLCWSFASYSKKFYWSIVDLHIFCILKGFSRSWRVHKRGGGASRMFIHCVKYFWKKVNCYSIVAMFWRLKCLHILFCLLFFTFWWWVAFVSLWHSSLPPAGSLALCSFPPWQMFFIFALFSLTSWETVLLRWCARWDLGPLDPRKCPSLCLPHQDGDRGGWPNRHLSLGPGTSGARVHMELTFLTRATGADGRDRWNGFWEKDQLESSLLSLF